MRPARSPAPACAPRRCRLRAPGPAGPALRVVERLPGRADRGVDVAFGGGWHAAEILFGGRFGDADPFGRRRGSPLPVDVEVAVLDGGHVLSLARGPGQLWTRTTLAASPRALSRNGVVDLGERMKKSGLLPVTPVPRASGAVAGRRRSWSARPCGRR